MPKKILTLIFISLSYFSVAQTELLESNKFLRGKIDLLILAADSSLPNKVGLILVDFGSDRLRYFIYQDYHAAELGDTVYFRPLLLNRIPIAQDLYNKKPFADLGAAVTEVEANEFIAIKLINFKFHSFGFDHRENNSLHTKIHQIVTVESDQEADGQPNNILFLDVSLDADLTTTKRVAIEQTIDPNTGRPINKSVLEADPIDWYFSIIGELRDGTEIYKISKDHFHEK